MKRCDHPACNPDCCEASPILLGVAAILWRNGKVLMHKRLGSHGAGTWSFPGGHIDAGESPVEAVCREIREETGLLVPADSLTPLNFTSDVFEVEGKRYITLYFEGGCPDGEPMVCEPTKNAGWKWVVPRDWPGELFLPVMNLLKVWKPKPGVLVGTEILTFYDTNVWVACWTRRDIVAQGKTEREAVDSLLQTIVCHWIFAEADGLKAASVPTPSEAVLQSWQSRHRKSHESCTCNRNARGDVTPGRGARCEHSHFCPQALPWQKEYARLDPPKFGNPAAPTNPKQQLAELIEQLVRRNSLPPYMLSLAEELRKGADK